MGFIRKQKIGSQKLLRIGVFSIPYETIKTEKQSILKIGCVSMPYELYDKNESKYIKIFGLNFCVDRLLHNRKQKNFKNRNLLTDEYCKRILKKELSDGLGYIPNIDNPKTLNEKILWMKFNDHNPLITKCCDKYAVKEYVKDSVGEKYILPVLGVWEKAEDINFDELPRSFALKVNWSSGYNIIVKDKNELNYQKTREKLNMWCKPNRNSYYDTFNWGYKNMKPVIYAEPYIEECDGQLYDYKLFICNGKFEFLFIATDRLNDGLTYTFFDKDFNHLPLEYGNKPNANPLPKMPHNINNMIKIAEKLAEPFKFVRIDFYEINEEEFFVGEMTFYSGGGTLSFSPKIWDEKLGEKIKI